MGCGRVSCVLVYRAILRVRTSDFFGIVVVRNHLDRKWVCATTRVHLRPRRDSLIGDDTPLLGLICLIPRFRCFRGPMLDSLPREFYLHVVPARRRSAALPSVSPPDSLGKGTTSYTNCRKRAQTCANSPRYLIPSYLVARNEPENQPMV